MSATSRRPRRDRCDGCAAGWRDGVERPQHLHLVSSADATLTQHAQWRLLVILTLSH
jgi:hypothetical protein